MQTAEEPLLFWGVFRIQCFGWQDFRIMVSWMQPDDASWGKVGRGWLRQFIQQCDRFGSPVPGKDIRSPYEATATGAAQAN